MKPASAKKRQTYLRFVFDCDGSSNGSVSVEGIGVLALNGGSEKLECEPGPEHSFPGVGTIGLRFERLIGDKK